MCRNNDNDIGDHRLLCTGEIKSKSKSVSQQFVLMCKRNEHLLVYLAFKLFAKMIVSAALSFRQRMADESSLLSFADDLSVEMTDVYSRFPIDCETLHYNQQVYITRNIIYMLLI